MYLVVFGSLSSLCTSIRAVDSSVWFPKPSALPLHQLFVPIGVFGGFGLSGVSLTSSCLLAAIFRIDSSALCVRVPDASAWFLGPFGSSGRSSGLLPGESNLMQPFLGLLMRSDLFSGLRESISML